MPDYAVIDVETTRITHGQIPQTLFWGYADEHGYKRFNDTDRFVRFLHAIPPRHLLHHANFDIIQLLVDGYRGIGFTRSHNGKFILTKLADKHTCINTYAVFPVALNEIFRVYGYTKTSLDDLDKRNYEDCVIGLECLLKLDQMFLDLIGVSPLLRHTIASTVFHAAENYAGKLVKDLRFPEAYRGGRVDVFNTNELTATRYDINSSYPSAFFDAPEKSDLLHVKVRSMCPYGPLAHALTTDKLLFPEGLFTSWVYQDTLDRYILPNNPTMDISILERHTVDLSWLHGVRPLIQKLYVLKKGYPDTSAQYLLGKLGINACYGRIGLRGQSERCELLNYFPANRNGATIVQLGWSHYLVWYQTNREPRSNFPLASYITDNSRGRLYEGVVRTNALYCDTDSVDTEGLQSPGKVGSDIGNWKIVGSKTFKANNLKDYVRDGIRKVKGGVVSTQWSLKKAARGLPAVTIEKTFSGVLRKRILLPDGTTKPIRLEE